MQISLRDPHSWLAARRTSCVPIRRQQVISNSQSQTRVYAMPSYQLIHSFSLKCVYASALRTAVGGESSQFSGLPTRSLASRKASSQKRNIILRSAGKDAVQGWIDVAKLVSGGGGVKSAYKDLAYQIGRFSTSPLVFLLSLRHPNKDGAVGKSCKAVDITYVASPVVAKAQRQNLLQERTSTSTSMGGISS